MILKTFLMQLSKLPGLGPRSGRRLGLYLLKEKEKALGPLIHVCSQALTSIDFCPQCGNLDEKAPCGICTDLARNSSLLCIVGEVEDLWAVERSGCFKGQYHVLGGLLSALNGITPAKLRLSSLLDRIKKGSFTEVIFALNPTVEGQTTAHYVQEMIMPFFKGNLSRLAYGVPLGGELDYLDEGTVQTAMKSRVAIES